MQHDLKIWSVGQAPMERSPIQHAESIQHVPKICSVEHRPLERLMMQNVEWRAWNLQAHVLMCSVGREILMRSVLRKPLEMRPVVKNQRRPKGKPPVAQEVLRTQRKAWNALGMQLVLQAPSKLLVSMQSAAKKALPFGPRSSIDHIPDAENNLVLPVKHS